jgi:2-oxoisovalerate dehydrogenase E1 component
VVACPARPDDAAAMLRTCVAAAVTDATVSVFLEPIALYHRRDLYDEGDAKWLAVDSGTHAPIGAARLYKADGLEIGSPRARVSSAGRGGFEGGRPPSLTLITFGNGVPMSLRVAHRLERAGIAIRVVDMRWLAPLPMADVLREANVTGRTLLVDETRASGGVSEGVLAALVDLGYTGSLARATSADSFIPLGDAALRVLLSEEQIEAAALKLTT